MKTAGYPNAKNGQAWLEKLGYDPTQCGRRLNCRPQPYMLIYFLEKKNSKTLSLDFALRATKIA